MKRSKYYILLITVSFLFVGQSCSKDIGPIEKENNTTENVKFATDVQPIFSNNCTGCHGNSGNLDLSSGNAYANLVGVNASGYSGKRVIANDADNSILYKKIDNSGAYGSNMPLGQNLSSAQINTIKQWIIEGALNN